MGIYLNKIIVNNIIIEFYILVKNYFNKIIYKNLFNNNIILLLNKQYNKYLISSRAQKINLVYAIPLPILLVMLEKKTGSIIMDMGQFINPTVRTVVGQAAFYSSEIGRNINTNSDELIFLNTLGNQNTNEPVIMNYRKFQSAIAQFTPSFPLESNRGHELSQQLRYMVTSELKSHQIYVLISEAFTNNIARQDGIIGGSDAVIYDLKTKSIIESIQFKTRANSTLSYNSLVSTFLKYGPINNNIVINYQKTNLYIKQLEILGWFNFWENSDWIRNELNKVVSFYGESEAIKLISLLRNDALLLETSKKAWIEYLLQYYIKYGTEAPSPKTFEEFINIKSIKFLNKEIQESFSITNYPRTLEEQTPAVFSRLVEHVKINSQKIESNPNKNLVSDIEAQYKEYCYFRQEEFAKRLIEDDKPNKND